MQSRAFLIAGLVLLLLIGISLCDPLTRFGAWLSYVSVTNPMWNNGFFGAIDEPPSARPEDVVHAYLGPKTSADILEVERIHILGAPPGHYGYWAALIRKGTGREILLFQYWKGPNPLKPGSSGYWHVRQYAD